MGKTCRMILGMAMAFALSACAGGDVASRGAVPEAGLTLATQGGRAVPLPARGIAVAGPVAGPVAVQEVRVAVSRDLTVSEANSFLPRADIVWRGDAPGDRHAQVAAIVQDAAGQAVQPYREGRPVILELDVTRFHGVTEKTRYTVGGTHNMRFDLTLRDAATGAVVMGPRPVVADVRAAGGAAAIAEERAGRTQKVVVTERLVQVIRQTLGVPIASAMTVAAR